MDVSHHFSREDKELWKKKKILFIFKVRESMCMSRGRGGGEERKRESDAVSLLSLEPQVGLSLKTARS